MRRTPEELHNLAEAEKEKAIRHLNNAINIQDGYENNIIREAVECIIKAAMLYNSEIHTESLNELFEKMKNEQATRSN